MPLYIVLVVINFKQKFMTNFNCIYDGKFVKSKNASSYRSRGLPPLSSQSRCYLDHYPLTPVFIQLIKTSRLKLDLQQSILIFAR